MAHACIAMRRNSKYKDAFFGPLQYGAQHDYGNTWRTGVPQRVHRKTTLIIQNIVYRLIQVYSAQCK